jgi:hypothetical protein
MERIGGEPCGLDMKLGPASPRPVDRSGVLPSPRPFCADDEELPTPPVFKAEE